ncbi:MAG: phospho-N-acetylmuramoyl-pentapeptide-transferase [Corallococcus sp.]|nr:phospho-N-acetylmuramoyl-pentapeptide-transferase [Corallococcus sp.]
MKEYILPFAIGFIMCLALLLMLIPILKKKKAGQEILEYVIEHSGKQGTPTMGGIAFIISIIAVSLIFCGFSNRTVCVTLSVVFAYAVVGFLDDFIKIKYKHNMGLRPYQKIIVQLIIALIVAFYVYGEPTIGDKLYIPFAGITVNIGKWIIPLVVFIYLACTNGVNLTDGLDGLATSTTIFYLLGFFVLLFIERKNLEEIGNLSAATQYGEVMKISGISVGCLLAFLLFNCFPAKVFMGDVGSLALGALVACLSIFTNMSLVIPLLGIMFVVSCLSVIMQVVYFKITKGKRIFLMAPYHHHLQKKGFSEVRIGVIYCTVTIGFGLLLVCFGG